MKAERFGERMTVLSFQNIINIEAITLAIQKQGNRWKFGKGEAVKIEQVNEYNENGCNFSGNLVIVRYYEDMKLHARFGNFGASLAFDFAAMARKMVAEKYPHARVLLSIPDFVAEV